MKKLLAAVLIAIFSISALTSCGQGLLRFSVTYTDVFDTVTVITAYAKSEAVFNKAANAAHDELLRLHKLYDIYNEYDGITNLATLNRLCGESAQPVGKDIEILIKSGLEYAALTDGKLNIAAGNLTCLWHDCIANGTGLPTDEALIKAKEHISYKSVKLENGTLSFDDPKIKLDVGATAKGYAAERAAAVLEENGISDYLINAGGNVVSKGKKPDGEWKIGIQDPAKQTGEYRFIVAVKDKSVVTSGSYERFFEYGGKRYSHIIDLEKLYPSDRYVSVTVLCGSSADGDALSTALFCMSVSDGKALLKQKNAEALWIYENGEYEKTDGFKIYE